MASFKKNLRGSVVVAWTDLFCRKHCTFISCSFPCLHHFNKILVDDLQIEGIHVTGRMFDVIVNMCVFCVFVCVSERIIFHYHHFDDES